jgi:Arc/MetJ-type ribon-helix-helix transcriptional regulator
MDGKEMINLPDTEKITINMNIVELGQIDLLVEEGFYSNRTDFIRAAIRSQLDSHREEMRQTMVRRALGVGMWSYSHQDLEDVLAAGNMLEIKLVGMLHLADDISPELALAVIKKVQVLGVFKASPAVKEALADRTVYH